MVIKPSDVLTCFEAAGDVSESTVQDPLAEKAESDGLGFLDVDFASLYFFADADTAKDAGESWSEDKPDDVVDLFDVERRGNVLAVYVSDLKTEDAGVLDGCLAEAGEPEALQ